MPEEDQSQGQVDKLAAQVKQGRNFDEPPLERWNPPLIGDIDIEIRADGSWWHEGRPFERQAIVRLFASILRREEDGHYYLVTPGEKWRLRVEAHPLVITEIDANEQGGETVLVATLNTGKRYPVDAEHPLFLDPERNNVAGIRLPHGLTALCTRAAWYRLAEFAAGEDGAATGVYSGGQHWPLQ